MKNPHFIQLLVICVFCSAVNSCSVGMGTRHLATASSSVQVGVTTGSQVTKLLGGAEQTSRSGEYVYHWWAGGGVSVDAVSMIPLIGAVSGQKDVSFQSFSVECDAADIVRRKLFHEFHQTGANQLGQINVGASAQSLQETDKYAQSKSGSELISRIGQPTHKALRLSGERWVWVASRLGFANGRSYVIAELDRHGNVLSLRHKGE